MHFLFCLLMIAVCGAAPNDRTVVEVFVPPVLDVETYHAFVRAQGIVNEIYSEIGVRIVWRLARSEPLGCAKKPLSRRIVVALRAKTPAGLSHEVLAFSSPYSTEGPCVTLLMDHLVPMVHRNPLRTGFLLGHVLAHEIGHVLQGVARHSETGVMKDLWSEDEITDMPKHRLRFTVFDLALILEGLAVRGQR
jgi:hypothetical protein